MINLLNRLFKHDLIFTMNKFTDVHSKLVKTCTLLGGIIGVIDFAMMNDEKLYALYKIESIKKDRYDGKDDDQRNFIINFGDLDVPSKKYVKLTQSEKELKIKEYQKIIQENTSVFEIELFSPIVNLGLYTGVMSAFGHCLSRYYYVTIPCMFLYNYKKLLEKKSTYDGL